MEEKTCRDCIYFIQHWHEVWEGAYQRLNCGHCKYPRLKHRPPGTPACRHFKEKEISS